MQVTNNFPPIQARNTIQNKKSRRKPAFLVLGVPALFDLIHNGLEGVGVVHGEVRQNLTVQFDSFL